MNVTATLLGQMATFAVLVWFVNRYLWHPMITMLEARSKRISDGLAAAERGKHELELAEQDSAKRLRQAKQDAADIINAANKRANEIVEESKEKARREGQRQLEAAKAEIEQEMNRAQEHIREQVLTLSIKCAEKVLRREVSTKAHSEFIEKMITEIGG